MTILDRIVASTRERLLERKRRRPTGVLHEMMAQAPPCRSMAQALRTDTLAVIAEIKRASPSEGTMRARLSPCELASQYADAGANAVSVLTEEVHFAGSLEDLGAARAGTKLPILRKDFIVDEYQLLEARAYGADAVLLIATVLERARIYDLQHAAASLGLECLVEIYQEKEMELLDWDRITMLGVNNRDLHTFQVDVSHSLRLLQRVPPHVVRISESGLKSAAQLAALRRAGVDAVLIGETLVRAPHPGQALAALIAETEQILFADAI